MANTYKDIIITPNRGSGTADPTVSFRGGDATVNTEIVLKAYPQSNGTLSFEGSAGQLFSITNDLSGVLFSVNDVSGIPSIEVNADGTVELAPYSGNVGIGVAVPANITSKLYVAGDANITTSLVVAGVNVLSSLLNSSNTVRVTANSGSTLSNVSLNFVNTSTVQVSVTSGGTGVANIAFTSTATGGGGSGTLNNFPVSVNTGSTVVANGINFINSASVTVSVTQGIGGNANISFAAITSGTGTVTSVGTGTGLSGGPITSSGTISANIASTTVVGVTKLVDSVTSTDAANAATASSVKTAYDQATSAYDQANAAFTRANTANTTAVFAYGQANTAYSQANAAFTQANTARDQANAAFTQANTANTTAVAAYGQANAAFAAANTGLNRAQVSANSGSIQSNVAINFVNTASVQVSVGAGSSGNANVAFSAVSGSTTTAGILQLTDSVTSTSTTTAATPNSVKTTYDFAATKYSSSGGTISGDVTITGNLILTGGTSQLNVTNLTVNDTIILLGTNNVTDVLDIGFVGHYRRGATDTHAGIIRKATDKTFYIFDNYEVEPTNNVIDITGNNFRLGNVRLGIMNANSILVLGTSVATVTDVGFAYGQANAAYSQANSANSIAISAYGQANLAYAQANTANTTAVLAYGQANTANATAVSAYGQANAAFAAANNAANGARVSANSGTAFSNVSLNFVNTATVQVSVTNPVSGIANIAFTSVGGTTTPGGSNTQVQFNNNGALGASANFTYNTAPNLVSLDANLKLAGSSNLYFGGEQANNSVANSKFRVSYNASAMSLDFTFLG
jgi:hypothetical protein